MTTYSSQMPVDRSSNLTRRWAQTVGHGYSKLLLTASQPAEASLTFISLHRLQSSQDQNFTSISTLTAVTMTGDTSSLSVSGLAQWPLCSLLTQSQQLKAIGKSIPTLHWLFDLQISVGKLIGTLCSAALSTRVKPPLALKKTEEEKAEEALVHSTLWKSLLRGGYMVGKLTRSLSGAYVS